jgi:hypothetical protein
MEIRTGGKRNISLPETDGRQRVVLKDVNGDIVSYIKTGKNGGRITGVVPDVVFAELEDVPLRPVNMGALNIAKTLDLTNEMNLVLEKQNAIRQAFSAVLDFKAEIEDKFIKNKEQTDIALSELAEVARNTGIINDERYEEIKAVDLSQSVDIEKIYGLCSDLTVRAGIIESEIDGIATILNSHEHEKQTKESLGLGNVDNTSDIDKPVSKAVQDALDEKVSKEELTEFAEYIESLKKRQGEIENGIQSLGGICASPIPNGGLAGQVLAKKSDLDFDVAWIDGGGGGGTSYHNLLRNRDMADQHPISAITGLQASLTGLANEDISLKAQIDANADAILKTRNDLQGEIDDNAGDIAELQADTSTIKNDLNGLGDQVSGIEEKIPESASATNHLATKSELNTKLSNDTKYGSSLSLKIDNKSYILTAQLKDQNGDNLGTEQTVDLPLETMVVGAEYDENTKEVVLTLKNGETTKFSIADLVSGLQPTIADLDKIRNGASKGETAVQPDDIPVKDVQANGTSLLKDGVANIPIATSSTLGLVRPVNANGIYVSSSGTLNLSKLSDSSLVNKNYNYAVLVSQIDLATKVGVTTNTIELTDEEKANARNWIGALEKTQVGSDLSYKDSKLQLIDQDGKPIGSAVEIKASGGGSNDLFDHKWSDHILNDISWLRADTFSWQSGEVYKSAYEHLVEDFNNTSSNTETIGSYTITYYQANDGHKIVLPDQESAVQEIYEETGVAWYYILDVENKRFKLPRTKWGFTGIRDGVGNYIAESLPDHMHYVSRSADISNENVTNEDGGSHDTVSRNANLNMSYLAPTTYASYDNSTYQGNAPVQQRATQMYLYFYVGNYTKSAIEQTAGVTTEVLNDKLDTDLGNATATAKETVVGWGMPDFSRGVSKSWNTLYQAETNGFFYIRGDSNASHTVWGIISQDSSETNAITLASSYGNNSSSNFASIFPVPKGYYYKAGDSGVTNTTCIFYPVKGE